MRARSILAAAALILAIGLPIRASADDPEPVEAVRPVEGTGVNVDVGRNENGKIEVEVDVNREIQVEVNTAAASGDPARVDQKRNLVVVRRDGKRPIIINKRFIQVPGVTIRLDGDEKAVAEENAAEDQAEKLERHSKLVVTTLDGRRFKVELEYIAADGSTVERTLEGTADELETKMKDVPDDVRDSVRRAINGAAAHGADKKQSRAFRFEIEPRVEAGRRVLRISMRRPGAGGEIRIVEVEQQFDGEAAIQVADLLKNEVVAAELKKLGPAVREKVEATLERVQIPEVQVGVEKAQ